jgi:hypothetical protein
MMEINNFKELTEGLRYIVTEESCDQTFMSGDIIVKKDQLIQNLTVKGWITLVEFTEILKLGPLHAVLDKDFYVKKKDEVQKYLEEIEKILELCTT